MKKCNHYRIPQLNIEFLGYCNEGEELTFDPMWNPELVKEDIDPCIKEYENLPIIHVPESLIHTLTRDKRLENEGISSYYDLSNAYYLIRTNSLRKSKYIRDLVVEKFAEVLEFVNL